MLLGHSEVKKWCSRQLQERRQTMVYLELSLLVVIVTLYFIAQLSSDICLRIF